MVPSEKLRFAIVEGSARPEVMLVGGKGVDGGRFGLRTEAGDANHRQFCWALSFWHHDVVPSR
jgi:hypothetical protein